MRLDSARSIERLDASTPGSHAVRTDANSRMYSPSSLLGSRRFNTPSRKGHAEEAPAYHYLSSQRSLLLRRPSASPSETSGDWLAEKQPFSRLDSAVALSTPRSVTSRERFERRVATASSAHSSFALAEVGEGPEAEARRTALGLELGLPEPPGRVWQAYELVQQRPALQGKGVVRLEDVALIPRHADMTPYFERLEEGPLRPRRKRLHHPVFKFQGAGCTSPMYRAAHGRGVRYAPSSPLADALADAQEEEEGSHGGWGHRELVLQPPALLAPPPSPVPEGSAMGLEHHGMDLTDQAYFTISHGRAERQSAPFLAMLDHLPRRAGYLAYLVDKVEQFCTDYHLPSAYINLHRVLSLARQEVTKPHITRQDVAGCFHHQARVQHLLVHGRHQRFRAPDGECAAAIVIQTAFRRVVWHRRHQLRAAQFAAARVLWHYWQRRRKRQRIDASLKVGSSEHELQNMGKGDDSCVLLTRHLFNPVNRHPPLPPPPPTAKD
jgi:hypothetical protein